MCQVRREDRIIGCLVGTAVGDALGLPYEGLSRRRARRLFGPPDRYRFFFGRGMVSDDTEHTCMVAQSLIDAHGNVEEFQKSLARRFCYWLLGIPAGIGLATLRSIIRLWFGVPASRSGVFSAGNGPAMRAAILGVALDEPQILRQFVRASTQVTHIDPKAELGAFAIALAAQMAGTGITVEPDQFLERFRFLINDQEISSLISRAVASVKAQETTEAFADSLGLSRGVSGYVYHTVPVCDSCLVEPPGRLSQGSNVSDSLRWRHRHNSSDCRRHRRFFSWN